MKRWYYIIYFLITAGCFVVLGIYTLFTPQKEYSQNENRVLEQFPLFSWSSFADGEYQEDLEAAINDQIPGRDTFTATASFGQQMIGLKDVEGVYLGKDDYYLLKTTDSDINMFRYMENLRYVEYLSDYVDGQTTLLLVPSAGTVLSEKLPSHAPFYNAGAMYKAGRAVCQNTVMPDIRSNLKEIKSYSQVYYCTDHHWTLRGAYAGYQVLCKEMDLEAKSYEHFVPEPVTRKFLGTLHSRVLDGNAKPDTIYAATKLPKLSFIECDGEERDSIYDEEKLQGKDKYGYFFGGNYGVVNIKRKEKSEKSLLVFKDSFANSLVPFLLDAYGEITMIDLRYYRESVEDILRENRDADVLVLYEMSNFAEESNLWKLTK
ncbi:MAG: hypothetical protein J1E62_08555 [Lachnospiraceae bacterium]|nr:hypothetical protein [Lachnospiraceae bacterium]